MTEKGKTFFTSFGFLVGFMVLCIIIDMVLGRSALEKFLWLVLFGMIITNANSFIQYLQGVGKADTTETTQSKGTTSNSNGYSHSSGSFKKLSQQTFL